MLFPLRKNDTDRAERRPVPPIDLQVPAVLETATFASG
jgi:hypothetical protein